MIKNVILPSSTITDWEKTIRLDLVTRIEATFGTCDFDIGSEVTKYVELETYQECGLTHIKVRYHVIDNEWNEGIFILPASIDQIKQAQGVLVIHGTNGKQGKLGMMEPYAKENRAYATELAKLGYVTFSVDQYGFGTTIAEIDPSDLYERFYQKYPNWTLDGRRLWEQKRALDVMSQMEFMLNDDFGVIGNSLGGRAVTHLAAFDERIKVAVSSIGNSPNCSNQFRYLSGKGRLGNPILAEMIEKSGKSPWEYQELIALCSPRAMLVLEPFNDTNNPYVTPVMECLKKASEVYSLVGCPEKLAWYVHGNKHDTIPIVREFAYSWIKQFLPNVLD